MPKRTQGQPTQHQSFISAARELGCDDNEEAFDAKLKAVASAPPAKAGDMRKAKRQPKKG